MPGLVPGMTNLICSNFTRFINEISRLTLNNLLFFKITLPFYVIPCYNARVPFRQEGRWAYRHRTRGGMRWTRLRRDDRCVRVRSSRVVLSRQCRGQLLGSMSPGGRWQKSWFAGEITEQPFNHCAGSAGRVRPYLTILCAFSSLCTQACGCGQRPAFPAPSPVSRGTNNASPGRVSAAGMLLVVFSAVVPRAGGAPSIPEASRL